MTIVDRLYSVLVADDDDHGCGDLPESACRVVPGNAAKLVGGFTLQQIGDRIADPKTVLAWMLTSLGVPAFMTALLVPIRESGSLLPQVFLVPAVRRFGLRSRVWAMGAVGQSLAVALIGAAGLILTGAALGAVALGALAVFALARAVSSISAKDLIGKSIPKGDRGAVTGIAASVAGLAAIAVGLVLSLTLRDAEPWVLALIVTGSALLWLGGAGVILTLDEEPTENDPSDAPPSVRGSLSLLVDDAPFRRFVIARSLMLVSALSPPFVIILSTTGSDVHVSQIGPFVIATGIAGLIASPIWGRLADRSSRMVMAASSGAAAVIIFGFLGLLLGGLDATAWLGPATYLLLAIAHAGSRMGRKTYIVDMATGDERTSYVAVSNTVIGVILLGTGLLSAAIAAIGAAWALALLGAAGLVGTVVSLSMDEVEPGTG